MAVQVHFVHSRTSERKGNGSASEVIFKGYRLWHCCGVCVSSVSCPLVHACMNAHIHTVTVTGCGQRFSRHQGGSPGSVLGASSFLSLFKWSATACTVQPTSLTQNCQIVTITPLPTPFLSFFFCSCFSQVQSKQTVPSCQAQWESRWPAQPGTQRVHL